MKHFSILFLLGFMYQIQAQSVISGVVKDQDGKPIENINISLENTYDGTSTNKDGSFSFETEEEGEFTLTFSGENVSDYAESITLPNNLNLDIQMEVSTALETVVFSAGSMRASDNTNTTVMSSLDIVTTAGSNGNVIAALQTLPGNNAVKEDGRLFIRGGESDESSIFIDGLRVFQPYSQTAGNMPARGRFSPFLFKGMNFSTGGYDVNYGQAMSGILDMETIDFPTENSLDLSIMTVGVGAAVNKAWKKDALSFSTQYVNLKPMFKVLKTSESFDKAPESSGGEFVYRHQFEKGLFKSYFSGENSYIKLLSKDIDYDKENRINVRNTNLYWNNSYKHKFNRKWRGFTGFSVAASKTENDYNANQQKLSEYAANAKVEIIYDKDSKNSFKSGIEYIGWNRKKQENENFYDLGFNENIWAGYFEYTLYFLKRFGLKTGLRTEYSSYLSQANTAPRVSLAYKLGKKHNFNINWGRYFQTPSREVYGYVANENAVADQILLNYMYTGENELFRLEIYQKDYKNLIKYNDIDHLNSYTQTGNGYAKGIDVFYKNSGKHIENLQYWISYSYIDTERDYKDFETKVQPSFVAKHNASFVGKYWIQKWRSSVGITYSFNSGRPFNDKNKTEFMAGKSKIYQSIDLSWAYLIDQQKILFFSFSNVPNFNNVLGYQYGNVPNLNGTYNSKPTVPILNQFVMVGFFWTISTNKERNQLDTL